MTQRYSEVMERSAWPDERLDAEFGGLRHDLRDLRSELRSDMREFETGIRAEIGELRALMIRLYGGTILAAVGVIAAILARGA
jgi:hypothetical protein